MQDFQAAGQKYRSIKLMPNLSSGSFLARVQNSDTGYYSASFPVVLGDFGCDVTCQACRENSLSRSVPSLLWPLGQRKQAWVRGWLLLILDILLTNSRGFQIFYFFRLKNISSNSNLPSVLLKFIFVVLCQEPIGSCLCLNLISAFLIIMLLQLVTPDHKLLLISFPQLSSKSTTKNYTQLSAHSRCKPPFFYFERNS